MIQCQTYYSLLYGTMNPQYLVGQAKLKGYDGLLLADINNTTAVFDFVKACLKHAVQPLVGTECRNGSAFLYVLLAASEHGLAAINKFLSQHNIQNQKLPIEAPLLQDVYVLYPAHGHYPAKPHCNSFLYVKPDAISLLYSLKQKWPEEKIIALKTVSFEHSSDFVFHAHLRAIANNVLLSQLTPDLCASALDFLPDRGWFEKQYAACPVLLRNAQKLMSACSFSFDFTSPKNKKVFTSSRYDDFLLLEKLALEGMEGRYHSKHKLARERIIKELEVIHRLGFSAYFLITWDIIRYSKNQGMYHVGRGSGGNSIVAYCLGITDIDPIELDLYFERFINAQRTSPPDFDIDYSWTDRDKVQQYIFHRYGRDHTALLGTINTFRDRSVIREMGKVYGLPKGEIDQLVKYPNQVSNDPVSRKVMSYASRILDFPHHRSIHAGGVLVSEKPIYYYTALDLPPKGFPSTQWDMYVAEDIGFEKLDILSQRGIAHIKEAADWVEKNRGQKIDVHRVEEFKRDKEINARLYNGEAIGCFYIESPAMRGLLKKLKCSDYLRLVAASSIIRPGVAKSGMMKEYIRRFHQPERVKYLHPVFEQHLGETFGVMVYQEDVIKISHHFAGLGLDDSDILRRAMSGKFRSRKEFDRIREAFFYGCAAKGHSEALAKEVWRQIESFSGYAFCKAHSASYAVESYQSLYLKTYFPDEFHVAVINNFGGFYHTRIYVNEARRYGAKIHLPCVNRSFGKTSLTGRDVFLGFQHIKSLESRFSKAMMQERLNGGTFLHLQDFVHRLSPALEQVLGLIRTGAFRFSGKSKKALMWEAHFLLGGKKPEIRHPQLFEQQEKRFQLPPLDSSELEDAYDEMELLGFPVSLSYFDMLKTTYRGNAHANELMGKLGQRVRMLGDLVTIKYVHTVKKQWMHFGCFLDEKGEFFDTVHFPQSLRAYPFRGYGMYLLEGRVVEEFGFPSVEVEKLGKLPLRFVSSEEGVKT